MKGHSGTGFHKKNCCGLQQFATICSRDKRTLHNIGCSAGPHVARHEENVLNVKCPIPKISTFVDTCISGCFWSWQDSPCGHGMHHQLRDGRSSFDDLLQDHLTNSPLVKESARRTHQFECTRVFCWVMSCWNNDLKTKDPQPHGPFLDLFSFCCKPKRFPHDPREPFGFRKGFDTWHQESNPLMFLHAMQAL